MLTAPVWTALEQPRQSHPAQDSITWEQLLTFEQLTISQLPPTARLHLSLLALAEVGEEGRDRFKELGSAALQLFSHDRYLAQVNGNM